MSLPRWGIAGLLAVAGTALLVGVAWVSMYLVSRLPQDEFGA